MIRQAYVAGSYSAGTPTAILQNISRALAAACALTRAGYFAIVPHTSGSHRASWDEAMGRCRATIQGMSPARDCLVLLPGWQQSRGALDEFQLALELGLPTLTLEDALTLPVQQ